MKLNNIFVSIAALTAMTLATSCSHEEIDLYSGCKAGIFIREEVGTDEYGNVISYKTGDDSFTFTKYGSDVTKANMQFNVKLMGEVADFDRPYSVRIVPEETTAIEGVDFDISSNKFCIKAGANSDAVTVTFLRNPNLIQNRVRVTFEIVPNEYFDTPILEYKSSSSWSSDAPSVSAVRYYFEFGESYVKPDRWDLGAEYYGAWTVNKFIELNTVMGWVVTDWDWQNFGAIGGKIGYGRLPFAASTLQHHLQEMADAGTPVLDDDGSFMQLGASYLVDYSAYK